jgi:hypothetical protein
MRTARKRVFPAPPSAAAPGGYLGFSESGKLAVPCFVSIREANMREDERIWAVKRLLFDYVKSPSLRHIRDPHSVTKLAEQIVRQIEQSNSIWRKWDGQREVLLKSALCCWIPVEDMRDFLNGMPGPTLTTTDVTSRLKAFDEEDHYEYAKEEFREGCLAIYAKEKTEGTELPAIIQLLREHVEREEERDRIEHEQRHQQWREEDRVAREQRLLSGADCTWTQMQGSAHWYCRVNGRTYRLSPTKDKMWNLYRVNSISDGGGAPVLGKYQRRGDATKAIRTIAYQPEPRW